ncbi:1482_t:CDS:1, partial [Scutellospora calospora]
ITILDVLSCSVHTINSTRKSFLRSICIGDPAVKDIQSGGINLFTASNSVLLTKSVNEY